MDLRDTSPEPNEFLSTSEFCSLLRIDASTAQAWRSQGKGPPYIKLGAGRTARVIYSQADVLAWIAKLRRANTSEGGA